MITIWCALLALQAGAPSIEVYKIVGADSLTAHVFSPPSPAARNVGVMLLHGGLLALAVLSSGWLLAPVYFVDGDNADRRADIEGSEGTGIGAVVLLAEGSECNSHGSLLF